MITSYAPESILSESKKKFFDIFVQLMQKNPDIPKTPIVDQLFVNYCSHDDHLKMSIEWMDAEKIVVNGETLYQLTKKHMYDILGKIFASRNFTYEQKMEKMKKILGDDKSD